MQELLRAALVTIAVALCAAADNWPGWRGPDRTGVSREKQLPLSWDRQANVRWRVPLPGPGQASPVVWADRVFLAQVMARTATLMCFNRADGALLWQCGVVDVAPGGRLELPGDCSATPVTDGERVIALFGRSLCCYDFQGEELWLRELEKQEPPAGQDASPILYGDLCIIPLDASGRLVAVDKRTGQIVWESAPPAAGGVTPYRGDDEAAAYRSTPLIIQHRGRDELIVTSPYRLSALEPKSGAPLWTCRGLSQDVHASVLWDGVLVALGSRPAASAIAVQPGGSGDVTETHRAWQRERVRGCTGSGIIHDGRVYFVGDDGVVECLELKTGRTVWAHALAVPVGRNRAWPSMLRAGEFLYVPSRSGDVFVLRAGPEFQVLCTNSVHEPTSASLAAAAGELFQRTDLSLWCFGSNSPVAPTSMRYAE